MSATADTPRWWRAAVGYEVYLRSFADGDGDGVGDLPGMLARLDHLAWLGVQVVWVTPFYPSPMHDHGYDVAGYTGVDPRFGTLDDLDAVIARTHELGLKLVVDLVPNHTSSAHPWFVAARSSRSDPHRDYYLWRDPAPDGGPPNNWLSHFGGPAWTLDEASGQYWCHLFLPEQPDLNWRDERVRAEFDAILTFWLDRGVDGFRIDVAHGLIKHRDFPDLPAATAAVDAAGPVAAFNELEHVHDLNQPENLEVYRRWRAVVEPYDAVLLGEVYVTDAELLAPYLRGQDGLHLSFWFKPLHVAWDAAEIAAALRSAMGTVAPNVAWVQASHDRPRPVTRFGGGDVGRSRALALATLLMGLPGTPFLYQGEELGLADGEVQPAAAQDPIAARAGDHASSRDGSRTPIPWAIGPGFGFTSGTPWLPFGGRTDADTVAVQRADPGSWLHRYRALVAARRELTDLHGDAFDWLTKDGPVIAYRRADTLVVANCGATTVPLDLPAGAWTVAFASDRDAEGGTVEGALPLPPAAARVLRLGSDGTGCRAPAPTTQVVPRARPFAASSAGQHTAPARWASRRSLMRSGACSASQWPCSSSTT